MPRKKKADVEVIREEPLSLEQVDYVVKYARAMMTGGFGFPNVFNPLGVSDQMKNISLNTLSAESTNIERALNNPKSSEQELAGFSEDLYLKNMIMKRMVSYLSDSLSWNVDWVCTNENVDYKSKEYQKDKYRLFSFFDKFNVKEEFNRLMKLMILEGVVFASFRDDYERYKFQQLPQKFSIISYRHPYGLGMTFNMNYFMQANVSLEMFHPNFRKRWLDVFGKGSTREYNPADSYLVRDNTWATWVDLNINVDGDQAWAFKPEQEIATRIPILAPLFIDASLQPLYRKLTQNAYMAAASKMISAQIPYNKDVKAGSVSNNFSITADQAGKFLQLVRNSISEAIGLAALPMEQIQGVSFDMPSKNILGDTNTTFAALSGISGKLIGFGERSNLEETRNSVSTDVMFIQNIYHQMADFLNYRVNKETKKYKFKFLLSGFEFDTYKRKAKDDFVQMAGLGFMLPGKAAEVLGIQRYDLERQLAEAKAEKWDEKLVPLIPAFQKSAEQQNGEGSKGRPQKKDEDLSEEGSESRDSGSNIERGGEV